MTEKAKSITEFVNGSKTTLNWNIYVPRPPAQPRTRKWFDAARRKSILTKEVANRKNQSCQNLVNRSTTSAPFFEKEEKTRLQVTEVVREAVDDTDSLSVFYNITCELGRGTYGTVFRGWEKTSGMDVAIKRIKSKRKGAGSGAARREARILSELQSCPSVVGLRTFIDDDSISERGKEKVSYIVMDLCGGGDLHNFLMANSPLCEEQAVAIVVEVVRVLKECHQNKILHGDVKASNFVIDSLLSRRRLQTNPSLLQPGWLKAIDFGTCRHIGIGYSSQALGTPTHWGPEVFGKKASTPADMWSLGVLTYKLLAGRHPFWSAEEQESMRTTTDLLKAILSRAPDYDVPALNKCSQHALDFLNRLLVKDEKLRMSAEDVENHPWLSMYPKDVAMDSNNLVPVASFFDCYRIGPKFPTL